jgi:hypothetical protein
LVDVEHPLDWLARDSDFLADDPLPFIEAPMEHSKGDLVGVGDTDLRHTRRQRRDRASPAQGGVQLVAEPGVI